jgi:hypothetical protein
VIVLTGKLMREGELCVWQVGPFVRLL